MELIEKETIQPGPEGLMKLSIKETVFTAFNALDIENEIKQQYFTTQYPVGDKKGTKFWTWGYFKRDKDHQTYKEASMDSRGKIISMEKYQQLGTSTYFEGALLDARPAFDIHHNNYDLRLFVKYVEVVITPL